MEAVLARADALPASGVRRHAAGRPRAACRGAGRVAGHAVSRRSGRDLLPGAGRGAGDGCAGGGACRSARVAERVVDGVTGSVARSDDASLPRPRSRVLRDDERGGAGTAARSAPAARAELGRGRRPLRGADRHDAAGVLQAMAGARHGGAEIFFVRLAAALNAPARRQRVLIRRDPARAHTLRAGGVAVGRDPLRRRSRSRQPGARSAARSPRSAPDIVMTWMSRATRFCPRGDFVHVARLGGYYDLKYYRALRSSGRQHARHRRLRRGAGLAARAGRIICRISFPMRALADVPGPEPSGAAAADERPALGARARPPASEQGVRPAARSAGHCSRACICGWPATDGCAPHLEASGGPARRRRPACAFSAGGAMRPRCWPAPTFSSVRRATSRWAMW